MRRTQQWAGLGMLIAFVGLGGCSSPTTGPTEFVGDPVKIILVGDELRIQLEVSATSIDQGDTILATARVENLTSRTLELTSSCTRLTAFEVVQDGEPVPFEGTINGCGFALTDFPIDPGATLTRTREIRAAAFDGSPVEPGMYSVRFTVLVPWIPDVEVLFEVR